MTDEVNDDNVYGDGFNIAESINKFKVTFLNVTVNYLTYFKIDSLQFETFTGIQQQQNSKADFL